MAEPTEVIEEIPATEEPPAEELPADDPPAEEEQQWQLLSVVSDQMGELTTEVRTCNQRAQDQAATISQLLSTNQELTRQLQENNQLLASTRAPSTDPNPSEEPPATSPPKPSETEPTDSEPKPPPPPEPPIKPPEQPAERVQRRRRSI